MEFPFGQEKTKVKYGLWCIQVDKKLQALHKSKYNQINLSILTVP